MAKHNTVTVVVSAFNEEQKIKDCLESVAWADEIILVDNQSTDKTKEVSQKYDVKIFTQKNNLMLNVNKNFGFTKASSDWILSLDADERVSKELAKEIQAVLQNQNSSVNGYRIPRKNIIFGKPIMHTGWYPDYQTRLFRRGKGRFEEKHVHEMIKTEGSLAELTNHIVHYNYENIAQFLHKHILIYAPNEADELIRNGYTFDYLDAIRFPSKEFLSRFFAREGYKDGLHGLVLSCLMGFYHLIIFVYIWEKNNFKEVNSDNFLREVHMTLNEKHEELDYWVHREDLKKVKNPLKKLLHKIKRKF